MAYIKILGQCFPQNRITTICCYTSTKERCFPNTTGIPKEKLSNTNPIREDGTYRNPVRNGVPGN